MCMGPWGSQRRLPGPENSVMGGCGPDVGAWKQTRAVRALSTSLIHQSVSSFTVAQCRTRSILLFLCYTDETSLCIQDGAYYLVLL